MYEVRIFSVRHCVRCCDKEQIISILFVLGEHCDHLTRQNTASWDRTSRCLQCVRGRLQLSQSRRGAACKMQQVPFHCRHICREYIYINKLYLTKHLTLTNCHHTRLDTKAVSGSVCTSGVLQECKNMYNSYRFYSIYKYRQTLFNIIHI